MIQQISVSYDFIQVCMSIYVYLIVYFLFFIRLLQDVRLKALSLVGESFHCGAISRSNLHGLNFFQQITALIHLRLLCATWTKTAAPTWPTEVVREPTLFLAIETSKQYYKIDKVQKKFTTSFRILDLNSALCKYLRRNKKLVMIFF